MTATGGGNGAWRFRYRLETFVISFTLLLCRKVGLEVPDDPTKNT